MPKPQDICTGGIANVHTTQYIRKFAMPTGLGGLPRAEGPRESTNQPERCSWLPISQSASDNLNS
eukprot:9871202-Prorocentrum_lima.AAC.1